MREYGSNINLPSLDNLFSSEQERQDAKLEKIQILPLTELHPFRNHPFQVRDDDEMDKMVDSVKEYGVMTPAIVRPRKDGGYEIVAGHRRCHASQRAGVETMPCIVRDMDDDTAIILMVDSNCQREHILPSEKAKAYEMKLEAIRRKAGRPSKENTRQVVGDFESADLVGQASGESGRQVQRFIRLNKLTPELMKMVDDGKLKTTPAVELSYLTPEEQEDFLSYMESEGCTPSLSQAQKLKEASKESVLTPEKIQHIMAAKPPSVKPRDPQLMIPVAKVERYFPKGFTSDQMQQVIVKLLENYARAPQTGCILVGTLMTRLLVVEPSYCPYQAGFASAATAVSEVIEGESQILKPFGTPRIGLICSKAQSRLKYNRQVNDEGITVRGRFLICGLNGDKVVGLSKDQADRYSRLLFLPQVEDMASGELPAAKVRPQDERYGNKLSFWERLER